MGKLFDKARQFITLNQRRAAVEHVFAWQYYHEDGLDHDESHRLAEIDIERMSVEEIDMWYAQFLLEEKI